MDQFQQKKNPTHTSQLLMGLPSIIDNLCTLLWEFVTSTKSSGFSQFLILVPLFYHLTSFQTPHLQPPFSNHQVPFFPIITPFARSEPLLRFILQLSSPILGYNFSLPGTFVLILIRVINLMLLQNKFLKSLH